MMSAMEMLRQQCGDASAYNGQLMNKILELAGWRCLLSCLETLEAWVKLLWLSTMATSGRRL
jgi:hypothetical protein